MLATLTTRAGAPITDISIRAPAPDVIDFRGGLYVRVGPANGIEVYRKATLERRATVARRPPLEIAS